MFAIRVATQKKQKRKNLNQEIRMRASSSYVAFHLFFAFLAVGIASAIYVNFSFSFFQAAAKRKTKMKMLTLYVRMWPNNGLPWRISQTVNTVGTMRRLRGSDWLREERWQRVREREAKASDEKIETIFSGP